MMSFLLELFEQPCHICFFYNLTPWATGRKYSNRWSLEIIITPEKDEGYNKETYRTSLKA